MATADVWTLVLLLLRLPVIVFGGVLIIHLLFGFINEKTDDKLDETRKALFWLTVAIVLDALIIAVGYAHSVVGNTSVQVWLASVNPLLVVNRIIYAYAVIRFWRLFCCIKK
jgi:hypothetical protein